MQGSWNLQGTLTPCKCTASQGSVCASVAGSAQRSCHQCAGTADGTSAAAFPLRHPHWGGTYKYAVILESSVGSYNM